MSEYSDFDCGGPEKCSGCSSWRHGVYDDGSGDPDALRTKAAHFERLYSSHCRAGARAQGALREIDQLCEKELNDPYNDFGDVSDTLERCQKLAREILTEIEYGEHTGDTEAMYRRALEIIDEEQGSMSVREEQARGAMAVLGHILGRRKLEDRAKWLPSRKTR